MEKTVCSYSNEMLLQFLLKKLSIADTVYNFWTSLQLLDFQD